MRAVIPSRLVLIALSSVMAMGAALASAAPAAAHDELTSVEPASGSTLPTPPDVATFTYSDEVAAGFTAAAVTPPGDSEIALGPDQVTSTGAVVAVPLLALAPAATAGTWKVVLRIVSADGHPVESVLEFSAGAAPVTAPTTVADTLPAPTSDPAPVTSPPPASTSDATSVSAQLPATEPADEGLPSGLVAALVLAVVVVAGGAAAFAIARRR